MPPIPTLHSSAGSNMSELRSGVKPFRKFLRWRQKFLSQLICDEVVRRCGKPSSRVTNRSQFNRLRVTIFHREKSCLAPKSGVDILRHHVYLRFRRRLKGLT
jgi:hypothetical protein